jgi:ATP-dependent DNA helicase DinG
MQARSPVERRECEPGVLGLDAEVLARFAGHTGPLAVVDLETTGLVADADAEILEFGALLVDPGAPRVVTLSTLLRPRGALPRAVKRLTGLDDEDVREAPLLAELVSTFRSALEGRVVVAHNAEFERAFLSKFVAPELAKATYLDTLDLLALTHPDAPDLRLESFTRILLGAEEHHRALHDALDTARIMSCVGAGSARGEIRYQTARRALERFAPESRWLALLSESSGPIPDRRESAFVEIGETREPPVPFDEEAIVSALADEARGRRHFPDYRVREEQIRLARRFVRNLADQEILLLEGGTGIGKSLAYLAAAIPFTVGRAAAGERTPLVISTRTKLLQDQLLDRDIGAAARFLGAPELRAVSIKGRANYACARRLGLALQEGSEQSIFPEDQLAYAVLETCARLRPHGEIGSIPPALLRRYPALRTLLRRAVAARSEQCSREQCSAERDCPLGRRRAALADADLIVANHDLVLRWPPDYPRFEHVIVDEVHELAQVADEVYALDLCPEDVLDRFDEIFGRPAAGRRRRRGSLLPAGVRRELEADARAWRRELSQEFVALGRALADEAGDFGEVQVPDPRGRELQEAAKIAGSIADRLDRVADEVPEGVHAEGSAALGRSVGDLRSAAEALRLAFEEGHPEAAAGFEAVLPPFDRWRLMVRQVSTADSFHAHFIDGLRSFAGVSASLFVGGDAFAALGDLEIEARAGERLQRDSVPSPFPYAEHMRVVALEGRGDLVGETTAVLESLARQLGGRTLGLFTSLRRMYEVSDELSGRLREEGIDVLAPRRASDDPGALVARFVAGAAVLLGARKFWQGIDIPGDRLQAVVIEKLPFEVPTELRRRREARLESQGIPAFQRCTVGRMLLNLKQMVGRLIRTEEDRGIVVIVEGRTDKGYFRRLEQALPPGSHVGVATAAALPGILAEVGIGGN